MTMTQHGTPSGAAAPHPTAGNPPQAHTPTTAHGDAPPGPSVRDGGDSELAPGPTSALTSVLTPVLSPELPRGAAGDRGCPPSRQRHPPRVESGEFLSPIGRLGLILVDDRLVRLCLTGDEPERAVAEILRRTHGVRSPPGETLPRVQAQLAEYFEGTRTRFSVPARLLRVGPFHRRVYAIALAIAPGSTLTFGQVAHMASRPAAVRAVGVACARNPLPLLIPTHRIVGAAGRPGGPGSPDFAARCQLLEFERDRRGDASAEFNGGLFPEPFSGGLFPEPFAGH